MADMNDFIQAKLEGKCSDENMLKLALQAVKLSASGLPEASVAEQLEAVVRRLVKDKDIAR
ncbi:MAG: hypothetical protein WC749_03600 [Dehalococcoidia bacterium]